jgi:hypothetical protein
MSTACKGCCGGGCGPRPGSLEYERPYKPANNAGCCGRCQPKDEVKEPKKVKTGCFIRHQAFGCRTK